MIVRGISEVDVREMLEDAHSVEDVVVEGRFLVTTWRERRIWELVVEPDHWRRRLVVVTAYAVEGRFDEA